MPFKPKPDACLDCPAYQLGKSFVPPVAPPGASLYLLGQGPGEMEAYQGLPFVGPSGNHLDRWLRRAGIPRHKCWVGNVVQCWLPKEQSPPTGNRAPRPAEVDFCRATHWGPALAKAPVVVPIGVPAMKAILGPASNEDTAGRIVKL